MKQVLFILFFFESFTSQAQKPILLDSGSESWEVKEENLLHFVDSTGLSFSELLAKGKGLLRPLVSENIGKSHLTHWVKLRIENPHQIEGIVINTRAEMGRVSLYFMQDSIWSEHEYAFPYFNTNPIRGRRLNMIVPLEEGAQEVFMAISQERLPILLRFEVTEEGAFRDEYMINELFIVLCFGALLVMIFYNLFLYFNLNDRIYCYYVLFVLGSTASLFFINRFYLYFTNPNIVYFFSTYGKFTIFYMSMMGSIFFINVLELKKSQPIMFRMGQLTIIVNAVFIGLSFTPDSNYLIVLGNLSGFIGIFFGLWVCMVAMFQGHKTAKYFLFSWLFPLGGGMLYVLWNFGYMPDKIYIQYAPLFGSVVETIIISLLLADRVNQYRISQEEAQRQLRLKTEENIRIISQQNELLEEKVVQRTKDLKELSNYKEGLTHMIAHDLKNPLNIILYLTKKERIDGDHLKELKQSGKMMLQMVTNMLDVQKYEELSMQLKPEDIPLSSVITNAKYQVELLLTARSIQFKTEVQEGLMVHADLEVIIRVFVNLFSNAIKYNKLGGRLLVKAHEKGGKIHIAVEDDGKGIHKDQLPFIFDKFWQLDPQKSGAAPSTGLGLTFCKMAIEAHDGEIRAESELGHGTTITFTLGKGIGGGHGRVISTTQEEASDTPMLSKYEFSEEDEVQITKTLAVLRKLPIFKYGHIEKELDTIQYPSEELSRWMNDIKEASLDWDKEVYEQLCSVLTKSYHNHTE